MIDMPLNTNTSSLLYDIAFDKNWYSADRYQTDIHRRLNMLLS